MPTFLECHHCQRLYSKHSLLIHEKNCIESVHKKLEKEKLKMEAGLRRTNASLQTASQFQIHQKRGRTSGRRWKVRAAEMTADRPKTRSLSRYNQKSSALRICFVCGEQYDEQVIEEHKEKCHIEWSRLARTLLARFHIHEPQTLNTPSIDGTIDVARENMRAVQSSYNCQIVRCRCCNARIALQHASSHQCVRFEPTIEFFC